MTKTFEEELKDIEAETFSHWDGCTISKKEFINYADVVNLSQGWVSPEEYEKLVKNCAVYVLECKNINRVNAQLTKENEDLKSQLQQQALPKTVEEFEGDLEELIDGVLDDDISDNTFDGKKTKFIEKYAPQALPVVPECVAKFVSGDENELSKADRIAYLLKSVQGDSYYLTEELPGDGTITVDEGQELYNWAICQHHETILKLWNGYTVEKQLLFYLKHIDMSKSDAHLNWYLAKGTDNVLIHQGIKKGKSPKLKCILKLTQQEIDSMQTGSYEQIEVAE